MALNTEEKIEPEKPASSRDYSHAWRALRHRNFRLFFGGQSISLIGTWMTRIATAWLVYRLTKSSLLLGTVSFAGQIPTFLLAPFAGVLVDQHIAPVHTVNKDSGKGCQQKRRNLPGKADCA